MIWLVIFYIGMAAAAGLLIWVQYFSNEVRINARKHTTAARNPHWYTLDPRWFMDYVFVPITSKVQSATRGLRDYISHKREAFRHAIEARTDRVQKWLMERKTEATQGSAFLTNIHDYKRELKRGLVPMNNQPRVSPYTSATLSRLK